MLKKLYFAKISQKKVSPLINNKNFALYKSATILQKLSQSFSGSFNSNLNKEKQQMHYHTNSNIFSKFRRFIIQKTLSKSLLIRKNTKKEARS